MFLGGKNEDLKVRNSKVRRRLYAAYCWLTLKERIEFLLGVFGSRRAFTRTQSRMRRKIVAVVCGFLIPDPLGLGLGALVVFARVVEPAIPAAVKVRVAMRAGVAGPHAAAGRELDRLAAFPAAQPHIRPSGWGERPRRSSLSSHPYCVRAASSSSLSTCACHRPRHARSSPTAGRGR